MAYPKRKLIADCGHLPYTADDAARIVRTGQLDYVQNFPRPENETGFYLADLLGEPILSWPPDLPKFDPRGNPSAAEFESWKKAQDSKIGIAGNYYSFKGCGRVPCHSGLEERHLGCFEMNPFVVEIRGQYPEWDRSVYWKYKNMGMRMPKRSLMTIDFVLTLNIPGRAGLHYHAVSIKPHELLLEPSVQRRHKREAALLREWRCTHEVMTEHSITVNQAINNRRLFEYMRCTKNIAAYRTAASDMAVALLNDVVLRTCDRKIEIVASRAGWSLDEGYRIFAIANFLGYLAINHKHELLPDKPLYLLQP
jgi:hypothetical protein